MRSSLSPVGFGDYVQALIETTSLGPVAISRHVIRFFAREQADGDETIATNKAIESLQSTELEKLTTPMPSQGLEFWIHRSSSLVFTVLLEDGYKVVSMVVKADMSNFIFDS